MWFCLFLPIQLTCVYEVRELRWIKLRYMKMSVLAEKLNARNGDQISKNLVDFWFNTYGYDINPDPTDEDKNAKNKNNNEGENENG